MQKLKTLFYSKLETDKARLSVVLSFAFLFLFIMLSYGAIPEETNWEVGMVAPKDVLADRSLTYEDTEETTKRKEEVVKHINLVYKISTESFNTFTLADIDAKFLTLEKILLDNRYSSKEVRYQALKEKFNITLPSNDLNNLGYFSKNELENLHARVIYYTSEVMNKGISENNLSTAYTEIVAKLTKAKELTSLEKKLALAVFKEVNLQPTAIFDETATKEKETIALKTVEPATLTLKKGQTIVNKGDIVTKKQYGALLALGYTTDLPLWVYALGVILIILFTFYMMYHYSRYFSKYSEEWGKTLKIFIFICMLEVGLMPLMMALNLATSIEGLSVSGYLIPMALGGMLISYLRSQKDSLFMLLILSLYLIVFTSSVEFVLVGILGSLAGIAQSSYLSKRSDLVYIALTIAFFNGVGIFIVALLKAQLLKTLIYSLLAGMGSGFLSVVLAFGILPYMEVAFKITTPMTLIELANPTKPLLKRLLQEAPGTYHHSLMVANLGETIADELGANGLLVRVAAYYHDIGKLKRPVFFSENQLNQENVHDSISPMLSTLIITSHVKDGVQMAKEAGLPETVIDLISQHHGNSVVGYFYMKAKTVDKTLSASDFRYHQKKPQTKEAAILMIADTVEAAVRSKKGGSRGEISGFIRQLITAKYDDGQFEECDLTFKDLNKIAEVCTRVMTGLYHKRIEYPSKAQLDGK